jgi:hypothetical protein
MDPDVVERLALRGGAAGAKLRERFTAEEDDGDTLTWKTHRWTRYRSTMAIVFDLLSELAEMYRGSGFAELVREPHNHYALPASKREAAAEAADALFGVAEKYRPLFEAGAPRPRPDLRIVPKM